MQLFLLISSIQILSLVCDNASNNDTLVQTLAKEIPTFRAEGRIRCLGHVFNLCVRALLRPFSHSLQKRKSDNTDAEWLDLIVEDLNKEDDVENEIDENAEAHDEQYLDSLDNDEEVDMQSSRPECTMEQMKEAAFSLFKVSLLFVTVHCLMPFSSQIWPRKSIGAHSSVTHFKTRARSESLKEP